jgi:hypothetical protein
MTTSTKGRSSHENDRFLRNGIRVPKSLAAIYDAQSMIKALESRNNNWKVSAGGNPEEAEEGPSKEAFAASVMKWFKPDGQPDRRRVEDACTLTRDQKKHPSWVQEMLLGKVVAYSPSLGGMVLLDIAAIELPLEQYAHILAGDLQRQRQHKTENQRRLVVWNTAGQIAMNSGDAELARLFWQGEGEMDRTGVVSMTTTDELFRVLASRNLLP